jgi:hypothetical protein
LASIGEFVLEPAGEFPPDKRRAPVARRLGREELAALAAPASTAGGDHEDE